MRVKVFTILVAIGSTYGLAWAGGVEGGPTSDKPKIGLPETGREEVTDFRLPTIVPGGGTGETDGTGGAAKSSPNQPMTSALRSALARKDVGDREPLESIMPEDWEPTLGDLRTFRQLSMAEVVFTARLASVTEGVASRSFPPIRTFTLRFAGPDMIVGSKPDKLEYKVRITSMTPPRFDRGATMLVAALRDSTTDEWELVVSEPATDQNKRLARLAAQLPVGWTLNNEGQPLSPFTELGEKAWPEGKTALAARAVCAETGRPALLVPSGIDLAVAPVIDPGSRRFVNPFGDGKFTVTVTNTTDQPLAIPALITDGETIFWADSLLIAQSKKTYVLPWAGDIHRVDPTSLRGVVLPGGKSLSTVVNTLGLTGVTWPRGGARVRFVFCLGDRSTISHFYYRSSHHDALRTELQTRLRLAE